MTGLTNHREYYSEHYFAELLAGDLKVTLERWKAEAEAHPDSEEHREPHTRLRSLSQPFFKALEKTRRSPDALAETQREFLAALLPVLGYPLDPTFRALGHGSSAVRIPLLGEVTTQSGAPALWIIETLPDGTTDDDLAADPLSLSPQAFQYEDDPQKLDPQLPGRAPVSPAPTGRPIPAQGIALGSRAKDAPSPEGAAQSPAWEEILSKDIYGLDEPPRWVLFSSLTQLVLCDRMKWAERRFLSFDLREIFDRRDDATLRATAALLHRESTCPADGLLDTTLPTGPIERTIEYQAPFTLQNRETDYATVWAKLDAAATS